MITIVGPKEGIEKAEHEIRWISDEQVLYSFHIIVDAIYYLRLAIP